MFCVVTSPCQDGGRQGCCCVVEPFSATASSGLKQLQYNTENQIGKLEEWKRKKGS